WFLHVRFHRTQDPALLDGLVHEYERYALSIARRFHREREPREDLDQVAREALVGALHRFDPERGLPFPSFATPTIVGALRRHFRDRGWAVRVPRQVHELTVAARTTTERLTPVLGRPPTIAEVAHELGVDLDDLLNAEEAAHARETASLDATPDEGSGSLLDQIGHEDGSIDLAENLLDLRRAMAEISADDRALLQLYYFENCSQVEIAQRLGVSQMQVSRLLTSTLRRLRRRMGPR
ncbi:MAG TPA: sigma-70 family RNA polymerase sigma factor, partial [Aquihabitans sp.]|nr:sigma-70 family RNA polymerase sigma factor [Aquihabitans sp.]